MNKPIVLAKKQILKIIFDNKDKFVHIGPEISDLINTPAMHCMGCYNKTLYAKLDIILHKYNTDIFYILEQMLGNKIELYPY
jgi:hypothetical protein